MSARNLEDPPGLRRVGTTRQAPDHLQEADHHALRRVGSIAPGVLPTAASFAVPKRTRSFAQPSDLAHSSGARPPGAHGKFPFGAHSVANTAMAALEHTHAHHGPPGPTPDQKRLHSRKKTESLFRVQFDGDDGGFLLKRRSVHERLDKAHGLRLKYQRVADMCDRLPKHTAPVRAYRGMWHGALLEPPEGTPADCTPPTFAEFSDDMRTVLLTVENSVCAKACGQRLDILHEKSRMHNLLNADIVTGTSHTKMGGVFSPFVKVDNSVRMSRCVTAQELLAFTIEQYRDSPRTVIGAHGVAPGTGGPGEAIGETAAVAEATTFAELFDKAGVDPARLTVDGMGWHPSRESAIRGFDVFSDGNSDLAFAGRLTRLLLRTDHDVPFFPQLLRLQMHRAEQQRKYPQAAEFRFSISGRTRTELHDMAAFLKRHDLLDGERYPRSLWFINVDFDDPLRDERQSVQDAVRNIVAQLVDATVYAKDHPHLALLLAHVGGLHVDAYRPPVTIDKSHADRTPDKLLFSDRTVDTLVLDYYLWVNLAYVNVLRRRQGLNKLTFRRGVGTGDLHPMLSGYCLASVLTNCAESHKYPVLQYLLGMHRVGLTVSPLMNNFKGVPYSKAPLQVMLNRSLRVSLATEEPLHFHHDANALLEEYATAEKLLSLEPMDTAELAFNSIQISAFPEHVKRQWLDTMPTTFVWDERKEFRENVWLAESDILKGLASAAGEAAPGTPASRDGSGSTPLPRGLGGPRTGPSKATATGSERMEIQTRWTKLSAVSDDEYFAVIDKRVHFPRTVLVEPKGLADDSATQRGAQQLVDALKLRDTYIWKPPPPWERNKGKTETFARAAEYKYVQHSAVYFMCGIKETSGWHPDIPTVVEFKQHLEDLKAICANIEVKDLSYRRLEVLEYKFRLHLALNRENEAGTNETTLGLNRRDFYHATKVDTHIHMAAGMTARHLRRFIVGKLLNSSDDIVDVKKDEGRVTTYGAAAKSCGITERLTVDALNVQADHTLFERFDNFNNHYNPMARGELRTMFLKTDNYMGGRYFAEIINQAFADYTKDQNTFAENRLSVYGIDFREWSKLADWFDTHGVGSKHNKWLVQIPRVYKVFRGMNKISSFAQYLDNIFKPLWDVSMDPSKSPGVHNFLRHVSGFDSVDNEATIDSPFETIEPQAWVKVENPPYNYYMYYLWVNIRTLNTFRSQQGLSILTLRPHCGESGSDEHLIGAFLTADKINHGINLSHDPSLEYLYYLAQVGLAVSPLSNNALFLQYLKNPFPGFFRRGLNVSLSTDDPLMFHQTREPLVEEYSIAAKVWGFSPNDLCEIAKNSALQSGYSNDWKRERLGKRFYFASSFGNDSSKSHLSDIRVAYRFETYHAEANFLERAVRSPGAVRRAMKSASEEHMIIETEDGHEAEEVIASSQNVEVEQLKKSIEEAASAITAKRVELDRKKDEQKKLAEQLAAEGQLMEELVRASDASKLAGHLSYTPTARQHGRLGAVGPRTPFLHSAGRVEGTGQDLASFAIPGSQFAADRSPTAPGTPRSTQPRGHAASSGPASAVIAPTPPTAPPRQRRRL